MIGSISQSVPAGLRTSLPMYFVVKGKKSSKCTNLCFFCTLEPKGDKFQSKSSATSVRAVCVQQIFPRVALSKGLLGTVFTVLLFFFLTVVVLCVKVEQSPSRGS